MSFFAAIFCVLFLMSIITLIWKELLYIVFIAAILLLVAEAIARLV